jgi:hypothetical protein
MVQFTAGGNLTTRDIDRSAHPAGWPATAGSPGGREAGAAAKRLAFVLTLIAALALSGAAAPLNASSWFKHGDPAITTLLFVYRPHLILLDRKVGVYPFQILQGGEPVPPQFAPLLSQALLQEGSASSVTSIPSAPWEGTPAWEADHWNEARRLAAVAADGRQRGFDFVVMGRVDSFFRTAAEGLMAKVTVWLVSTEDGAIVWYGAKKAEWLRRFSLEECVTRLAWSFAVDWRPPPSP